MLRSGNSKKKIIKLATMFAVILVVVSVMLGLMQPGIALTGGDLTTSDSNADVETEETWKQSFADVQLTDDYNSNLVSIANTQIGYKESELNYYTVTETDEHKGYTRYGAFVNDNYMNWDISFVDFCMNYAGYPQDVLALFSNNIDTWIQSLQDNELYVDNTNTEYQLGDLVFFQKVNQETSKQVGIITEINVREDGTYISVIEGNCDNEVKKNEYSINDTNIIGYALIHKIQQSLQEEINQIDTTSLDTPITEEETYSNESNISVVDGQSDETNTQSTIDEGTYTDNVSTAIHIGDDDRTSSTTTLVTKATEAEIENGYSRNKEFEFTLNYSLANTLETDGVYTAYYDLPNSLTDVKSLAGTQEGTIWDGGTKVGTYKIVTEGDHQRVIFTYTNTEWLENHSSDVNGTFKFYAKVSESASNNKQQTEIVFPGKDNEIDIPFEDGKVTGSKWHQVNTDGTIDFTITFDVTGEDENVTLTDTLGSNLAYIDGGTYTLDGNTLINPTSIDGSVATFNFSKLAIGRHEIKYKVKVADIDNVNPTNNKIDWKWSGLSKKEYEGTYTDNVSFQQESTTKVGSYDKDNKKIKWTVTVTPSNFSSVAGKTIVDTLTSANHKYDGSAIVVTNQWDIQHSTVDTFTLNSESNTFSYTFGVNKQWNVGQTYYIVYYTTPTDLPETGDGTTKHTYTNSIEGGPTGSAEITEPGSGGSGDTGTKIDIVTKSATVLADKRIAWMITIDPSKYSGDNKTLTDLKLTDRLDNYSWSGSEFDKESFKLQDADGNELNYVEGVDYELTFDDENRTFTLLFKTMPTSKVNLIYQTYTNETGRNQTNYVDSSYTIDGKFNQETDNAYGEYGELGSPLTKTGVVEGNKISWKIVMNATDSQYWFNNALKPFGTYTIKDILPSGLTYIDCSAKYTLTTSEWNHSTDVTDQPIKPTIKGNELSFDVDIHWDQSIQIVLTFDTYVETPLPTESDTDHGITVEGNKVVYHNQSTFERDGLVYSKANGDAEITNKILDKKASLGENNSINYRLVVNYDAYDLNPDSDYLELVDTLDVNSEIVLNSIKVTNLNTGENVEFTKAYAISGQNGVLTLTVPDSKALLVEYSVNVAGEKGDKLTIKNSAYLKNIESSNTSVDQEITIVESESTIRGDKTSITLEKIDDQTSTPLEGAKFELHKINLDNISEDTVVDTKTTSSNGKVEFKDLLLNELYYYIEIEAPKDYKRDETKHYFMIKGTNESYTKAYEKVPEEIKSQMSSIAGGNKFLVPNTLDKSYVLPSTGGSGTTRYFIGGAALMLLATFLYAYKNRHKPERRTLP